MQEKKPPCFPVPTSPLAAKMEMPCSPSFWKQAVADVMCDLSIVDSPLPHDMESTDGRSLLVMLATSSHHESCGDEGRSVCT